MLSDELDGLDGLARDQGFVAQLVFNRFALANYMGLQAVYQNLGS
eukprot:gene42021-66210_t